MRWRKRVRTVETTPQTSYAEIRAHRGGALVGYIPDEVFDAVTGRDRDFREGTFWLSREQSEALRAHPQFVSAGSLLEEEPPG